MPSSRPSFDDREMAEVALEHHLRGLLDGGLGLDRDDALRHPLPHARLGRARPLRDCAEEIALGDDPDHPHHVFHHDDGADASVHHLLGGFADRRGRVDGEDVRVHDFGDRGHGESLTQLSGAAGKAAGP